MRQHGYVIDKWKNAAKVKFAALDTYRVCALSYGYIAVSCEGSKCRRVKLPKAECEDAMIDWAEQYERGSIPECVAQHRRNKKEVRKSRKLLRDDTVMRDW